MKVGMIFECGPDGADQKVCENIALRLDPEVEIESITLNNKPRLIQDCGRAAARLLTAGCERILIIWDLYPPWRQRGQRPCRKEDREAIFQSLTRAGVTSSEVYLICITEELEAWLIADGRALSNVLSRPTRPAKIKHEKRPEQVKNPKKKLNQHFKRYLGRRYEDRVHAEKIVRNLPDFARIRRSESFVRFALKLTGQAP